MNEIDAARKLTRISSKYDNRETVQNTQKSVNEIAQNYQKKTPVPNVKGKPVSGQLKYSDDMSNAEFREWARANRIKI